MAIISEAKQFVISEVVAPALNSTRLSEKSKSKIRRTKLWVEHCRDIGNIYDYICRYNGQKDKNFSFVYNELKKLSMTSVEDIITPFKEKFAPYIDNRFGLSDLELGKIYSSWDISILSKSYNEQKGIYLVKEDSRIKAILTKVTLEKGPYENKWIDRDTLKHYMKSRLDEYKEEYDVNRAVITSNGIPIYVFVKNGTDCIYEGRFIYESKGEDFTGAKWFVLKRERPMIVQETFVEHSANFEADLNRSAKMTTQERAEASRSFPAKPSRRNVLGLVFDRNPHVVQEVLGRARGICELCKKPAPFMRKDGTPYLEVHHIIQLAADGEDTAENAVAVCPNCHRKEHYGLA